jgi:hypothetical protein
MNNILSTIKYGGADRVRMANMSEIHASMNRVQAGIATRESKINFKIKNAKKIPLSDFERDNLIYSYVHLNTLLKRSELKLSDILDINNICLYGASSGTTLHLRDNSSFLEYHGAMLENMKSFYKNIRPTWEWFSAQTKKTNLSPYLLAAGLYTKILNDSHLFMDGHQRTGSVLMAYILAKAGIEPFHLKVGISSEFFNISNEIKFCGGFYPVNRFKLNNSRDRLANFLMDHFHQSHRRFDHIIG